MHKFSKSMWKIMQTLNLLPTGEFSIVKYKKHGVWIEAAGTKIFIHFSETFTDPRKWDGEEWFSTLSEAQQKEMMGAQTWDAWKGGAFNFSDLSGHRHDDVYGNMNARVPLWELLGAEPPIRNK